MRALLFSPVAIIYGFVAAILRSLQNLKGRKTPPVFTVVVGNISVGGTGKTPMVMAIAQQLEATGKRVAILSRGYGRRTTGFIALDSQSQAQDVGEEPLEIFNRTGLATFVCENRLEGINKIINSLQPDIVILDDGFQHLPLKAHFNIILDQVNVPFYKNCVLPAGSLREFTYTLKDAQVIIFTKIPESLNKKKPLQKAKKYTEHVFFAKYKTHVPELDRNKSYVLVSALANNKALRKSIDYKLVHHFEYPDHHIFTKQNHLEWNEMLNKYSAELICTAKDVSKIHTAWLQNKTLHVVHSEHLIENNGLQSLIELILKAYNEKS
jgi:tetraacyldisaccharide 4'-kinase